MAKNSKKRRKSKLTAKTADKHVLYQMSVQDPAFEIDFIDNLFKRLRRRPAKTFREDFCGTALLCKEFVRRNPERKATGLDLDPSVLAWSKKHNIQPDTDEAKRVTLLQRNVLEGTREKFDVACALNFSYWIFKTREDLRNYFRSARRGMNKDGMFLIDAYGGWEAHEPMEERRKVKGFTYVWDQNQVDPINNHIVNYIHFEFPDGTALKRAFKYDWRLWSLLELRELLEEAGFSESFVYWENEDEDDVYRKRARAANYAGWLAYVVALP